MRLPSRFRLFLVSIPVILSAACSPAVASGPGTPSAALPAASAVAAGGEKQATGCPGDQATLQPCLTGSPVLSFSPTALLDPEPGLTPTSPATAVPTPTTAAQVATEPEPSAPDCTDGECVFTVQQWLSRPIAPPGRDEIDTSYRFGTDQDGQRDPHHGVELLNSFGTPVLAAADGVVEVAGDDRTTFFGPYSYFYGNLVVIRHTLPGVQQVVFSLYGHLSEILVKTGDLVYSGDQIGRVGMSGVATGSHLHFEVRLEVNDYSHSRNPELWLAPHTAPDGLQNGALAGRILDPQGNYLSVPNIVVEHLPAPDQPPDRSFYTATYVEKMLVGQLPWEESFALGDLPAGWYRISFVQYGFQRQLVQVFPGKLTVVTFRPGG